MKFCINTFLTSRPVVDYFVYYFDYYYFFYCVHSFSVTDDGTHQVFLNSHSNMFPSQCRKVIVYDISAAGSLGMWWSHQTSLGRNEYSRCSRSLPLPPCRWWCGDKSPGFAPRGTCLLCISLIDCLCQKKKNPTHVCGLLVDTLLQSHVYEVSISKLV